MVSIVAEIGCNHKGDLSIAKEMISVAAKVCKVDVAKFQKRCNRELLSPQEYASPHPVPENAYGSSYGLHREALEFSLDQHADLKQYCESEGVSYATSVWDLTSAKEICTLNPDFIKIASATNLHMDLHRHLCENFPNKIHISVGMTTLDEVERIVALYEDYRRAKDVVLYACTSGYPVSFQDVCLLEIERLRTLYEDRVAAIGFSGHHLGIAVDLAAVTLGATWVERHFTLDRTWKGTDHAASLEPEGMRRLARDIRAVVASMSFKPTEILDVELVQRRKLKWMSEETGPLRVVQQQA